LICTSGTQQVARAEKRRLGPLNEGQTSAAAKRKQQEQTAQQKYQSVSCFCSIDRTHTQSAMPAQPITTPKHLLSRSLPRLTQLNPSDARHSWS